MRRSTILAAVVVLSLLAVAPVVVAGQSGGDAGNVTTGDYPLSELRNGGTELENGPSSQRFLGEYGSATIRYTPVGPIQNGWEYLDTDGTLHADEVTIRTVRLEKRDNLDRTLDVTVVGWQQGTTERAQGNGTVERQAAVNQTVLRQQVTLGRGYDEATIDLPSSLDGTQTVTMWVEGYPDARWSFDHRSVPSTTAVEIDTLGEAWNYTAKHALLPGALFIVVGLLLGQWSLKQAFSGPDWGLTIWGIITVILGLAVLSAAYFQVAVVLRYFPWLFGVVLGVLAYGGSLVIGPGKIKVQMLKPHLTTPRSGPRRAATTTVDETPDAVTDGGEVVGPLPEHATNGHDDPDDEPHEAGSPLDQIRELMLVSVGHLPAKRGPDGRIGVPKRGIRPFFARLFADPAVLDKEDLMTKIEVEELDLDLPTTGIDELILLDPESDGVTHTAAHLERRWPVWSGIDAAGADWSTKLMGIAGAAGVVLGLPLGGWALGAQLGAPAVAAAVATLPAIVMGHTAKDGEIEFQAANQHFEHAWATLIDLQRAQADGKTVKEAIEDADKQRARTAQEILDRAESHDQTITTEMIGEIVGTDLDDPMMNREETPTPDAGGEDDDE